MTYWSRCTDCSGPVVSRDEVKCLRCQRYPGVKLPPGGTISYEALKRASSAMLTGIDYARENDVFLGHVWPQDQKITIKGAVLDGQWIRLAEDPFIIGAERTPDILPGGLILNEE